MNAPSDELDTSRLESAGFDLVRRGFDPSAVRDQLQIAAQEIRRLRLERDELSGRLAEFDGVGEGQLEAHRVAEALGAEATHVLEAAHLAARERADRAEREADTVRDEALTAAEITRAEAQSSRDELLDAARQEAESVAEDGRDRGRQMVAEAQTVRERMLRDLARKRQTGRAQVEQLRAGRDRLLESLTIAQESLDTAVVDLVNSVPEARAAAERAGLRVTSEATPTPELLEAEIEAARLVGHPLVDDLPEAAPIDERFVTGEMEAITQLDESADTEVDEATDTADESADDEAAEPSPDAEPMGEGADDEPVALYDIDSEAEAEAEVEATVEVEADVEVEVEADVDDVFARLRSSRASTAESVDEIDEIDAPVLDEATEDSTVEYVLDAERASARSVAADAAAKVMKKVAVEEQGQLLDGIRRSGSEAVEFVVDPASGRADAYQTAAAPMLKDLAVALGGSKRIGLSAAFAHIDLIALEPVRQRLSEVAERVDDADELSDTVRALYRESRSRRIPDAAAAAAVAVDGLVAVATAQGPIRWRVETGGPCGPDCADNALAGAIAAGEKFPTGDKHPPAHSACTCWLESSPID